MPNHSLSQRNISHFSKIITSYALLKHCSNAVIDSRQKKEKELMDFLIVH
jgi:hypothetical protein